MNNAEHLILDSTIYYSATIVPKFTKKLDTSSFVDLMDAGLSEMVRDGIALKIADLDDPYSLIIFPKFSPTMPYESMMTVLPNEESFPSRSSLNDFSVDDRYKILSYAKKIHDVLYKQARDDGRIVNDGFVFQHFNPYDLNPKTMFNGSVSHLHLHVQMYGHSLSEFPTIFTPNGKLKDYESSNRLLRDTSVSIFYEIARYIHPDIHVEIKNSGCIGFGNIAADTDITQQETEHLQRIISTWDEVWKEFSNCFVSENSLTKDKNVSLLPTEIREENIYQLLKKYPLTRENQKILLFLSKHVQEESPDVWRNFYHGPNGSLGFHTDYINNAREWLIAPRIFRSWARHLPLVATQNNSVNEWTTKNESGDGLVNNKAREEISQLQRKTLDAIRKLSQ